MLKFEDLQLDLLVNLCDALGSSDLRNLRLVDKQFNAAVGQSAIKLRPHRLLAPGHMFKLGRLFRNAVWLDLTGCEQLSNECLRGLPQLFPRLQKLNLSNCPWLTHEGVAQLAQLSHLKALTMEQCSELTLPDAISGLAALQKLNLFACGSLCSLPEGFSRLVSLRTLNLSWCGKLKELPESTSALSLLQSLNISLCRVLSG